MNTPSEIKEQAPVVTEKVSWVLRDKHGKVKARGESEDIILYTGWDLTRKCLGQASGQPAGAQYMAIGTDATAAAQTQTGLITEVGTRVLATYSEQETVAGYKDQWKEVATFGAGNPVAGGTITETGMANASSDGVFLNRALLSPECVKGADDSLEITITFTLTLPA